MSWQTNSLTFMLRNMGRKLGLNRLISLCLLSKKYEMNYAAEFFKVLRSKDCIWDVGANIGYYTRLFSQHVGPEAKIFAFEPSPDNFIHLTRACKELENAVLLPFGLGVEDEQLYFQQSHDEHGASSRIVDDAAAGAVLVSIRSATTVVASGIPIPNAMKIDVEGYEYEVLLGFSDLLKIKDLRLIGIEVHCALLAKRSLSRVPQQIETLLRDSGFCVSWPDPSHIIAIRESE